MNALETLAARFGIEASFLDARGTAQITTPATRQALLAAMGVDADSEPAALAALEGLEREEWSYRVPAAHVARSPGPVSVPITYPAASDALAWRLSLENGERRSGRARFEALPLLDRREIDGQLREQRSSNWVSHPIRT
jgi:hypothetical protein